MGDVGDKKLLIGGVAWRLVMVVWAEWVMWVTRSC